MVNSAPTWSDLERGFIRLGRPIQLTGMRVPDYYKRFCDWKEEMIRVGYPDDESSYIDYFIGELKWHLRLRVLERRTSLRRVIDAYYEAHHHEVKILLDEFIQDFRKQIDEMTGQSPNEIQGVDIYDSMEEEAIENTHQAEPCAESLDENVAEPYVRKVFDEMPSPHSIGLYAKYNEAGDSGSKSNCSTDVEDFDQIILKEGTNLLLDVPSFADHHFHSHLKSKELLVNTIEFWTESDGSKGVDGSEVTEVTSFHISSKSDLQMVLMFTDFVTFSFDPGGWSSSQTTCAPFGFSGEQEDFYSVTNVVDILAQFITHEDMIKKVFNSGAIVQNDVKAGHIFEYEGFIRQGQTFSPIDSPDTVVGFVMSQAYDRVNDCLCQTDDVGKITLISIVPEELKNGNLSHCPLKASSWILANYCLDNVLKVDKCLANDFPYLHSSNHTWLIVKAQHESSANGTQLFPKLLLDGDKGFFEEIFTGFGLIAEGFNEETSGIVRHFPKALDEALFETPLIGLVATRSAARVTLKDNSCKTEGLANNNGVCDLNNSSGEVMAFSGGVVLYDSKAFDSWILLRSFPTCMVHAWKIFSDSQRLPFSCHLILFFLLQNLSCMCVCSVLSDLKNFKQYMSSHGYDGVTFAKLQGFVWDPGQDSLYILEDKDIFEKVGKGIIPMYITWVRIVVIKDVQYNCIIMKWCEMDGYDGYMLKMEKESFGDWLFENCLCVDIPLASSYYFKGSNGDIYLVTKEGTVQDADHIALVELASQSQMEPTDVIYDIEDATNFDGATMDTYIWDPGQDFFYIHGLEEVNEDLYNVKKLCELLHRFQSIGRREMIIHLLLLHTLQSRYKKQGVTLTIQCAVGMTVHTFDVVVENFVWDPGRCMLIFFSGPVNVDVALWKIEWFNLGENNTSWDGAKDIKSKFPAIKLA